MRNILTIIILLSTLSNVYVYADAEDTAAVSHLYLSAAQPYTFPDNSAAFFVEIDFDDDGMNTGNTNLSWKMEGHIPGDRLMRHPFGVTLTTDASQVRRTITVTAIYNEDVYSSATVTVVPSFDAKNLHYVNALATPSFGDSDNYIGSSLAGLSLWNVPDGAYQISLFSPTPALFLEGSDAEFIPSMGAYVTKGEVLVEDGWAADVRIGYNLEGVTERTDNIALLAIYDKNGVMFGHGLVDVIFVEPWEVMSQMWLALPLWAGPTTSGGWSPNPLGVPPSDGDFESVVTALPMMISAPFVDTMVYWKAEGMADDDYFDERVFFSQGSNDNASIGRLVLGESPEEREITITATWVDNPEYYATERVLVNPNAVNLVPEAMYTIVPGGDFIQTPIRAWGIPDGIYDAQVRFWWGGSFPGLRIFGANPPGNGDMFGATNMQVEIIDSIINLNMGINVGNHAEWYTYHFDGEVFSFTITLYDPSFLEFDSMGAVGTEIRLNILPYDGSN